MNYCLRLFLGIVVLACPLFTAGAAQPSKPNIILILADDLGIANVSCYGADKFKTPQIDRLAKTGIRFEHCYSAPLCGPTRALLMTGRYAFRTGMTSNDSGPVLKPENEVMMPKILKSAGYVTAQVGKWGQLPLQPGDWGFDEYIRIPASGLYWRDGGKGNSYVKNGKTKLLAEGEYMPDLMHDFLMKFLQRHREEPFFVYYSMCHVHTPIQRTPDSAPDSKDLYADNLVYMDKLVAKLVAELERLKLRDNTLLLFVGDNGTANHEAERSTIGGRPICGHKSEMLEGGSLVPMIANWPGVVPAGQVSKQMIDLSDYLPTFAELTGAKLPAGVTIDGRSFASQLRGQAGPARDWIFVELGNKWYVREERWKLNRAGELFDMQKAPFEEILVSSASQSSEVAAARKRLQAVLDKLDPAHGKLDAGDGSGKHAKNRQKK